MRAGLLWLLLILAMNSSLRLAAAELSPPAADELPRRTEGLAPRAEFAGHRRLEREYSFHVALPVAAAFWLFTPVGEKNWAEGWRPIFVSADDAELREGCVFTVTSATPGGEVQSVWAVSRYAPPAAIEYRHFIAGVRATHITVRCVTETAGATGSGERAPGSGTRVTVRYVYHGLSETGDGFIAAMTEEKFRTMIESWRTAVEAFLKRGTPATP